METIENELLHDIILSKNAEFTFMLPAYRFLVLGAGLSSRRLGWCLAGGLLRGKQAGHYRVLQRE